MFGFGKQEAVGTPDYATAGDFDRIFQEEQSSFYALAFLLTANHQHAEQCVVSGIDDASRGSSVFREWAASWAKRAVIKNAIRLIFSPENNLPPEPWNQGEPEDRIMIDTVTALEPFERFVFVMTVLEGFSDRDCSILLSRATEEVRQTRERTLDQLQRASSETFLAEEISVPASVSAS